ncbi:hypothetical protein MKX01_013315, partial [Papaver californicum]
MARMRGALVKQVPRSDPMTTRQRGPVHMSDTRVTRQGGSVHMKFVKEKGGTSKNVLKSRKRSAASLTTPQRSLKRTKPPISPPLQTPIPEKAKSSTQAQRSLSWDVEPVMGGSQRSILRQPLYPPSNDVENNGSQNSVSRHFPTPMCYEVGNRLNQRYASASNLSHGQGSNPRVSPRRHSQQSYKELESTPIRSPRRKTLLARSQLESTPRRSPRLCRPHQAHEVAEPVHVSPEVDHRGCSQEATNSPQDADSSQPLRKKNTRGITTLPNVALRDIGEDKLKVEVSQHGLVGTFALECILAIGMWVRQSDNFPLTVRLFRDMPEEKIARVSKLVRDYYILVPDDAFAEKTIRTQMRLAYVRYRSELAKHYRSFDSHEEALLHPSPRIRNFEDWTYMCDFFNTDVAFKAASEKSRSASKAQALNHTNGTQSFARKAHERARKNLPTDPLSMFMVTHKASKLGKVCQDWQSEMNRLSEQVRLGEVNYTPEEIYSKVVDPRRYGAKRP